MNAYEIRLEAIRLAMQYIGDKYVPLEDIVKIAKGFDDFLTGNAPSPVAAE